MATQPLHREKDTQTWAAWVIQSIRMLHLAGGDMNPAFQQERGRDMHVRAYRGQTAHLTEEQ